MISCLSKKQDIPDNKNYIPVQDGSRLSTKRFAPFPRAELFLKSAKRATVTAVRMSGTIKNDLSKGKPDRSLRRF